MRARAVAPAHRLTTSLLSLRRAQHQESLKPLVGLYARCRFCGRAFVEHRALMQHAKFCVAYRNSDDVVAAAFKPQQLK